MTITRKLLLALALSLSAVPVRADELVVLSAAAMKTAVSSLPDKFVGVAGDHVRFIFGTAGFIRDKAVAGEPFDLVIVPPAPLADLVKRGLAVDGSRHDLGLVRLGAAVRGGAAKPPIDTPDNFKATLLAAPSIGLADPATGATSGIYLMKMFETMGVIDQIRAKLKFYPEGQVAMEAASRGEIAFGLGQISEILPVSGTDLIGPIPEQLQLKTIYAAGLAQHSHAPEAAKRLMQFLAGPEAAAAFKAQGFEATP